MCGLRCKNKMVFYIKCVSSGVCRVPAYDMEKTCLCHWCGSRDYHCNLFPCLIEGLVKSLLIIFFSAAVRRRGGLCCAETDSEYGDNGNVSCVAGYDYVDALSYYVLSWNLSAEGACVGMFMVCRLQVSHNRPSFSLQL